MLLYKKQVTNCEDAQAGLYLVVHKLPEDKLSRVEDLLFVVTPLSYVMNIWVLRDL